MTLTPLRRPAGRTLAITALAVGGVWTAGAIAAATPVGAAPRARAAAAIPAPAGTPRPSTPNGASARVAEPAVLSEGAMTLCGSGFPRGSVVYLKIDDTNVNPSVDNTGAYAKVTVQADGSLNSSVPLPEVAPGEHWVRLLQSEPEARSFIARFTVAAPGTTVAAGSCTPATSSPAGPEPAGSPTPTPVPATTPIPATTPTPVVTPAPPVSATPAPGSGVAGSTTASENADVLVRSTRLSAMGGRISVRMTCTVDAPCEGALTVRTVSPVRIGSGRHAVTVARGRYSVGADRKAVVQVALTAEGRRVLRSREKVQVRVRFSPATGDQAAKILSLRRR